MKRLPNLKLLMLVLVFSGLSCSKNSGGGGGGGVTPDPVPAPSNTFTNPLLNVGPDPWIVRKDNTYYYTHTTGNRISIWKTSQVSDLRNAPVYNVWAPPATGANSRDIWAPEMHFINNKWYLYYAADDGNNANHRIYVLENSSDDPLGGTWVSKGKIGDPTDKWAIDGTVMELNGQYYFLWSGWEGNLDVRQDIYIAKMSNPWTIEGNRVMIASPQYNWEKNGAPPTVNEAPEILKNSAGKVFLTYSASGCWTDDYSIGLITLKEGADPLVPGSWIKSPEPVFTKNSSSSAFGPGHCTFFKSLDKTEDWIIYHANPLSGQGCSDSRSPRMQKFTWNADGTPNFGQPVSTGSKIARPSGEKD